MNRLSVIIPTHNRAATLARVLAGYRRQAEAPAEIVVVDDGSNDATPAIVEAHARAWPGACHYLRQESRGPAAARNLGLKQASGELALFNDDDVIPAPEMVREHLVFHQRHAAPEEAALGRVAWHPDMRATPFMRWLGERGPMFGFGHFRAGQALDFYAFYTCNLSLKRAFLLAHGLFDERFPAAAFEDTELSWRLHRAGLRLRYHPQALGLHYQRFDFMEAVARGRRHAALRAIFDETDAGRSVRAQEQSQAWKRRWRKRWARRLVPPLAPHLAGLVDSSWRLPASWYALLYRYSVENAARDQATQSR